MSHAHFEGGSVCPFRTKRECDEHFRLWEDDRYVKLAAENLRGYYGKAKDRDLYSQVKQVLSGDRADLVNADGNPHMSALAKRLRAAIDRYRAASADGS